MAKARKSKAKTFNFEEFQKEFYDKDTKKNARNKGALYEFGVRIARESLSESEHDSSA